VNYWSLTTHKQISLNLPLPHRQCVAFGKYLSRQAGLAMQIANYQLISMPPFINSTLVMSAWGNYVLVEAVRDLRIKRSKNMKLQQASEKLNDLSGIPFGELFSEKDIENIIVNKGRTVQLLELALGMKLSNSNLDFEDGELKTNKWDRNGKPKETVFITQIGTIIDELITEKPFEETHLYSKIDNMLYVPVCKDGEPNTWMFLPSIHIDLTKQHFSSLREIWRQDYYSICKQLKHHIETSVHTIFAVIVHLLFATLFALPNIHSCFYPF
jgi:DNA mismatch repair protein MutH